MHFQRPSIPLQDEDITTEDSLKEACKASDISSDVASELLISIKDESIKEKLKGTTQEAFDLGVRDIYLSFKF